jgi:N-acyl homoserine lactone hydrolase
MTTVESVLQGFGIRTDEGSIAFCNVSLLRDGGRNILVDVGHVGRRSLLLDRLRHRGIEPADIDAIVLTHAHWDHCLNVDAFPNARLIMSPREHEYARQPHPDDWATPAWTGMVLDRHRVEEVRDGEEIADGVRILATPGHSPGSQAVLVRTPEGTIGVVGDALPNAASVAAGSPYLIFWSEEAARKSVARIVESCDIVYPGHDRAFRLHNGGFSYIETTRIAFFDLPYGPDGAPGATFAVSPPRGIDVRPMAIPAGVQMD